VDAGLAGSAVATQDVRVASLGTSGVMLAARSGTGDVRLEVWEARRKANNFIDDFKIVDHPAYVVRRRSTSAGCRRRTPRATT
jgi:hypothetical protein